jgi:hypothetical protein
LGYATAEWQGPPQPPEIDRRLRFQRVQAIGVPILLLLPTLALLGVFDGTGTKSAEGSGLRVTVEYPARVRYRSREPLTVSVENTGGRALAEATVRFDRDFLRAFSGVSLMPEPEAVTREHFVVTLRDIRPGEARRVSGELEAEAYGRHRGAVEVVPGEDGGGEAVRIPVETITYP